MSVLKVMSFNIHGGRSRDGTRDLRRVHALMDKLDVDVGVFQEMETRSSRGGAENDLEKLAGSERPHYLLGPNMREDEGWYGNLIVSRYAIQRAIFHDLQTRKKFEPRSAIEALVTTPLGPVRIVGMHLSLSPFERWREARLLMELVSKVETDVKTPLVLMGDVNEWQRPSTLLQFLDQKLTPSPCKATFPSWCPLLRLDRVWSDAPGFLVKAKRLDDAAVRVLSDHLPLYVEIHKAEDSPRHSPS